LSASCSRPSSRISKRPRWKERVAFSGCRASERFERRQRLGVAALGQVVVGQAAPDRRIRRAPRLRLVERGARLVGAIERVVDVRQLQVRGGARGVERARPFQLAQCLDGAPLQAQAGPQARVRAGAPLVEAQLLAERLGGRVGLLAPEQHLAVRDGQARRVRADGAARRKQPGGGVVAPQARVQRGRRDQRRQVLGLDGQRRAVGFQGRLELLEPQARLRQQAVRFALRQRGGQLHQQRARRVPAPRPAQHAPERELDGEVGGGQTPRPLVQP